MLLRGRRKLEDQEESKELEEEPAKPHKDLKLDLKLKKMLRLTILKLSDWPFG